MRKLIVGDIHEPVAHPGYRDFVMDVAERYQTDDVLFIGDIVDWHAISFHTRHPNSPGTMDEYEMAKGYIADWYDAFPEAIVCVGNHDERIIRLAEVAGIPSKFIRDYNEVWGTPGWNWVYDFTDEDGTYFVHGTGLSGMHPAYNLMKKMAQSSVMGHVHSAFGVKWLVNSHSRMFGLDSGCGVDDKAYAFAYGKHNKLKSVLGCGVILDGLAIPILMEIGPGEKYNRSRFDARPLRGG